MTYPAYPLSLSQLYPTVTPESPLPVSWPERLALTVAFGTLSYGAMTANLLLGGTGLALCLGAYWSISANPARRIRAEARLRFPGEPWAELQLAQQLRLHLLIPLVIALTAALCAAGYWWLRDIPWAAGLVAGLCAALIWFLPGLNPLWSQLIGATAPAPAPHAAQHLAQHPAQHAAQHPATVWSDETAEMNIVAHPQHHAP